jgi:hypothetical protein
VLRKITIKIEGVCSFLTYPSALVLTYPIPMNQTAGSNIQAKAAFGPYGESL